MVGGLYTKYILYQCKADPKHLFYVSSVRKHKFQKQYRIHDYACQECKTVEREQYRRKAAEEEERRSRELADRQNELFEANRREMMVVQATVEEEKRRREDAAEAQAEKLCNEFMAGQ